MEPLTTLALLAALSGAVPAATARPNWTNDKKTPVTTPPMTTELSSLSLDGSLVSAATLRTYSETVNSEAETVQPKKEVINSTYSELQSYADLQDGWDGDDSIAPSRLDIMRALTFVSSLPSALPLPTPMISSSGEIGLYWDNGISYLDINFDYDGTISLYSRNRGTNPEVETFLDEVDPTEITAAWYFKEIGNIILPMKMAA